MMSCEGACNKINPLLSCDSAITVLKYAHRAMLQMGNIDICREF